MKTVREVNGLSPAQHNIKTRLFDSLFHLIITGLLLCPLTSVANHMGNNQPLRSVQIIGSHNSYKRPLFPVAKQLLEQHDLNRAFMLDYSHPPLGEQLTLGLRHFELDVVLDPDGGRFIRPFSETVSRVPLLTESERVTLKRPGLKVMHVPDVDFASHCILFNQCLEQLKIWSDTHPNHLPIFVLINIKESGTRAEIEGADVLKFNHPDYALIDKAILDVLSDKVFRPDDLRRQHSRLSDAVKQSGWPSLSKVREKFIFVFDGNERQRDLYRKEHPSLAGRSMFASYTEHENEAAFMIINDPLSQQNRIKSLVKKGFLVRTRADGGNHDGRDKNQRRVQAAFESGAQIISTDFYPGSPQAKRFGFNISFDNNTFSRCNPLFIKAEECSLQ